MPTNQELCDARNMGFDPSSGLCVVNSRSEPGGWAYYDPASGTPVTAPLIGVQGDTIVWPKNVVATQTQPPIQTTTAIVPTANAAPDFLSGITGFLTAPSLFGLPTYVVIGAALAGVFILMQMDGGKKKGGGLF